MTYNANSGVTRWFGCDDIVRYNCPQAIIKEVEERRWLANDFDPDVEYSDADTCRICWQARVYATASVPLLIGLSCSDSGSERIAVFCARVRWLQPFRSSLWACEGQCDADLVVPGVMEQVISSLVYNNRSPRFRKSAGAIRKSSLGSLTNATSDGCHQKGQDRQHRQIF